MKSSTNLIWIDLEMTGLDPEKEKIIEIAAAVTDKHLNVLATSASYAIHQADQLLEKMDDWNKSTHTHTGLSAHRLAKEAASLARHPLCVR